MPSPSEVPDGRADRPRGGAPGARGPRGQARRRPVRGRPGARDRRGRTARRRDVRRGPSAGRRRAGRTVLDAVAAGRTAAQVPHRRHRGRRLPLRGGGGDLGSRGGRAIGPVQVHRGPAPSRAAHGTRRPASSTTATSTSCSPPPAPCSGRGARRGRGRRGPAGRAGRSPTRSRGSSDRVMASAREAFTSYGSCSILEPLQDLAELHLLALDDRSPQPHRQEPPHDEHSPDRADLGAQGRTAASTTSTTCRTPCSPTPRGRRRVGVRIGDHVLDLAAAARDSATRRTCTSWTPRRSTP